MQMTETYDPRQPEAQVLLWALREGIAPACGPRTDARLPVRVDWSHLLRIARFHRVQQLLSEPLRHIGLGNVPDHFRDQLDAHLHNNTAHSVFLTGELIKILSRFESHQIPAIPFKGPTLAVRLYEDVGMRQFGDIDILVRKDDVWRVKELMASLRYEPTIQFTTAQEKVLLKTENALGFVSTVANTLVEIHWQLSPKYLDCGLRFEDLWVSAVPVYPGGRQVWTMAPEPLFLFLCVHGAKHQWEMLGWIVDIARLMQVYRTMDWAWVISESEHLGLGRIVRLGLSLAQRLLGAEMPQNVGLWLQGDRVAASLCVEICERLFAESTREVSAFERFQFYRRVRERQRDRWRYYAHLLMTPSLRDWDTLPLPASLSFLYMIFRPIRLLRDFKLRPVKRR